MIQNIRQIKRKIRSVNNIKKITRAMEMVSAAKLRKVQDKLYAIRPYADKMKTLLGDLTENVKDLNYPLFAPRETVKKQIFIAISSDKGLCGSFNANIYRLTQRFLAENHNTSLITIGKKITDYSAKQESTILARYTYLPVSISFNEIRQMINPVVEAFESGKVDKVSILYTEFVNAVKYIPKIYPFLPIQQAEKKGPSKETKSGYGYIYEPGPDVILGKLIPRYVETAFYRILLESMSSEHAARMAAMRNATDSAQELIDTLTLVYNKARQATITRELIDIVGGAEALK
ncbi:MAG: ATP synthase F1 subunit gamma [Planctomycetes bacterium]|nr:ATP synthase F1 subunit gamma [Planctomycetota bacterium]